jgi:hypothetical protein
MELYEKYLMSESFGKGIPVKDFNKAIKKIKAMTSDNDHTNALAAGFELMGDKTKAQQAKNLARKIDKAGGYGPGDPLDVESKELYRKLMSSIKASLPPAQYKKFHGAF